MCRGEAWASYKEAVEYDFILTYYIAGIKLLAWCFDRVLYDIFYEMQETVSTLVPSYKTNKYMNRDAKEIYRLLVELIEQPMTKQDIDQLMENVRKLKLWNYKETSNIFR